MDPLAAVVPQTHNFSPSQQQRGDTVAQAIVSKFLCYDIISLN
jgi:D-lyxose ketol-isomerase